MNYGPDNSDDLDPLRAELIARAEDIAQALLGPPNLRLSSRGAMRWGNNGSFCLVLRGRKRGLCHDRETWKGGDLLWLIGRERRGSFAETVAWARDFLRMPETASRAVRPKPRRATTSSADEDADIARRIAVAQRRAAEAEPLDGTVAERYLTETRKIPRPVAGWPDVIRYHRGETALLVVATNDAGAVSAVQLVYLGADACKVSKEEAERRGLPPSRKKTFGVAKGAAVKLPGSNLILLLAEGPENGLTDWVATGRETWIALGPLSNTEPPPGQRLLACADDDAPHSKGAKSLSRVVAKWRAAGHVVDIALPWAQRRGDKSDFNALLQEAGIAAVRDRIEAAIEPPRPAHRSRVSAAAGRLILDAAIARFIEEARKFLASDRVLDGTVPIVHAIRGAVGLGKSDGFRKAIARLLAEMRARGDMRAIVVAGPTHKLNREQTERFMNLPEARQAELVADIWVGRTARDPVTQQPINCYDIEAVIDAQSLGLSVEESACRRKIPAPKGSGLPLQEYRCKHHAECPFQNQKRRKADLWFVPHELIFAELPANFGDIALLIVDESCWQKGLEGVEGKPITLSLTALEADLSSLPQADDRRTLSEIYALTKAMLEKQSPGNLRRDAARASGLTADAAMDAYSLTWRRKVDPKLRPGMSASERKAAMRPAMENRTIMRTARLFKSLAALLADDGPEASGWITIATEETDHGPVRVVRLRGRGEVKKGWLVPTLLLDANFNADLVRPYWPQVEVTAEIDVETPHMRLHQLIDRDWAKSALVPDEFCQDDPTETKRRLDNSVKLRAAVLREVRATNGRVLLVVPKAVEEHWRSLGHLPNNLEIAHHNDVAGRDEWGPSDTDPGIRLLIVVGRTLASAGAVERLAEALTGRAVTARVSNYERHAAPIYMADGTTRPGEADRHPDPIAEAIRVQICEGGLQQTIGRPRGVNRTAANPVDGLLLTDRPLPIPVDTTLNWADLEPSLADQMLNLGGVILDNAADAAEAYPEIWDRSAEAARKALKKAKPSADHCFHARCGNSPYRESSIGEIPAPRRIVMIAYQRRGMGCRCESAAADLAVTPNPEAWLTAKLGPLALCDFDPPELEAGPSTKHPSVTSPAETASAARAMLKIDEPEYAGRILEACLPHPELDLAGRALGQPHVADALLARVEGDPVNQWPGLNPGSLPPLLMLLLRPSLTGLSATEPSRMRPRVSVGSFSRQ